MKPVEATWEGRGVRRARGYLEPLVLLEPPAHNTGCCVIGLTSSFGTFVSFFVFYGWLQSLWPCTPPGCACTLCLPLKLVLLTVLDLCLFMPDPRLLDPVSLFLTDERSDAAVVGSGNKAMGTSPWLTFRSWCRTWGSIITIKSS